MRAIKLAFAALLGVSLAGCWSGPQQLTRSVDDWNNQVYVDSPWINVFMHFPVPVFPVLGFVASIGDFLITNPIAFWGDDAWDSKGTAYRHWVVQPTDGEVHSLMMKDGDLLTVYR